MRGHSYGIFSLTTRFCLPHEGMERLEYLSRGSAFLLDIRSLNDSTSTEQDNHLAVVTSKHVACPWLFPNYFLEKWHWLQHVNEDYIKHSLQMLQVEDVKNPSKSTDVITNIPLIQRIKLHPYRDVAMLFLDLNEEKKNELEQWRPLHMDNTSCNAQDKLLFLGHEQWNQDIEGNVISLDAINEMDEDKIGQSPKIVHGQFVGESAQQQAFATSEEILEQGMCGGAVLNVKTQKCIGLIEGIVPPLDSTVQDPSQIQFRQALANHVAFIPSKEFKVLVNPSDEDTLITGSAISYLSS